MFYQSIPGVDEAVSEVTSEPGTPNNNKPITASRARGHTLKFTTHGNQYHSKRSVVSHQLNSDGCFPGNFWWISNKLCYQYKFKILGSSYMYFLQFYWLKGFFWQRVGWNIQHFCILMQTSISMAFKFNKKKREYFKENLPQNFLVTWNSRPVEQTQN